MLYFCGDTCLMQMLEIIFFGALSAHFLQLSQNRVIRETSVSHRKEGCLLRRVALITIKHLGNAASEYLNSL